MIHNNTLKKIVRYFLSCCLVLASWFSNAQESKRPGTNATIDSLLKVIKILSSTSPEIKLVKGSDTTQINTLNLLSKQYLNIANYEQANLNAKEALKYAINIKYQKAIAIANVLIGVVYSYQGDYPNALIYYFKALKTAEEEGNKNGTAKYLGNIGIVNQNLGNFPKALKYYFQSINN